MRADNVEMAGLPEPGSTLGGKFTIERIIGKGATAVVFEARRCGTRQRVAIKMLLPHLARDPEAAHRFQREARSLARLHSPHVVEVIEVAASAEGVPYLVMERLEGHELAQEMKARPGFSIEEAVGTILQVCSAMVAAHALGIVHRDLKPQNIFLCGSSRQASPRVVKVLDFGISKVMAETGVTAVETILGSASYMAPEQVDGAEAVDARADVWSLGVILYEMLARQRPFRGGSAVEIISALLKETPAPLSDRRPDAPQALVDAVHKALTKERDQRFGDVSEFARAIAPFGPHGVWPQADAAPAAAPGSTSPAWRSWGLVALLVGLGVVALIGWMFLRSFALVGQPAGPPGALARDRPSVANHSRCSAPPSSTATATISFSASSFGPTPPVRLAPASSSSTRAAASTITPSGARVCSPSSATSRSRATSTATVS